LARAASSVDELRPLLALVLGTDALVFGLDVLEIAARKSSDSRLLHTLTLLEASGTQITGPE